MKKINEHEPALDEIKRILKNILNDTGGNVVKISLYNAKKRERLSVSLETHCDNEEDEER
jgi:hypothetical protein